MEGRVYAISYIRDRFVEEVNRIAGWQAFESASNFVAVRAPLQRQQLEEFLLQQGIHVKFISVPWEGTWMRVTVGKESEMQLLISAFCDLTQQAEGFPSSRVTV
jgi:histidinol-phosphate/aromatic aminotransferase/cobyric acid decarboxylase-like protein